MQRFFETSNEKSSINCKLFLFGIDGKKSNFNIAPLGCFFKIYRYWYTDLLIEGKFHVVSQYLPDSSDKFADAMSKSIVVSLDFCHFLIIVSFKGGIFYYVVSCVDQCIAENMRARFDIRVRLA